MSLWTVSEYGPIEQGLVGELWPTSGATIRRLGISSEDTLAEVACGNGYFALPAARITDPAEVFAIDIDEALLNELTHFADQQEIANVVPIHGDARVLARQLPECVDVVLMANTFHGIDDKPGFVSQAIEALRSDGRFIIVNWHDWPRETTTVADEPRGPPTDLRLSPDETEAIVSDTVDMTPMEQLDLPAYHYALLFHQ